MVWGMCREQGWVGADGSSGGTAGKEVGERGAAEHAPMTPEEWKDFIRDEVDKLATLYEEACDTARRNYPVSCSIFFFFFNPFLFSLPLVFEVSFSFCEPVYSLLGRASTHTLIKSH